MTDLVLLHRTLAAAVARPRDLLNVEREEESENIIFADGRRELKVSFKMSRLKVRDDVNIQCTPNER